jgi:hypothetical protein
LPNIKIVGDTLLAVGDIGYEQAGEFARLCDRFLEKHKARSGVIDLSQVGDLVSPCLTAIYDDARLHRPTNIKLIVPTRLGELFAPGEIEGLFSVETI